MNKIVINRCYGGFSLSMKAIQALYKKKGQNYIYPYKDEFEEGLRKCSLEEADWLFKEDRGDVILDRSAEGGVCCYDINCCRHDKDLVEVVEELGKEANGDCSDLRIVEIPGNKYRICEYDGYESIEIPESIDWITID